jgi:hypothetical protein
MRTLNLRKLLIECGIAPLGDDFKVVDNNYTYYRKLMPIHCSAWDRGFFFQVTLLELNLEQYSETHATKPTFCLPAPYLNKTKTIFNLDGEPIAYPVFNLHIVVNRSIFPPWDIQQNTIEWHTNLTGRTKGIAHELLYGEQYAKYFDWPSQTMLRAPSIPSIEEENRLLCPDEEIERRLQSIEDIHGCRFETDVEFLDAHATTPVQSYYRLWLEHFAVERDVCHERTLEWLAKGVRKPHNKRHVNTSLRESMGNHGMKELTHAELKKHAAKMSPFYTDYLARLRKTPATFPDEDTAHWYTALHVEQAQKIQI